MFVGTQNDRNKKSQFYDKHSMLFDPKEQNKVKDQHLSSTEEDYTSLSDGSEFARPSQKLQNLYYDSARTKIPFINYYDRRYGQPEVKNDTVYVEDYIKKLVSYRQNMRAMGIDFDQNHGEYDVTSLI